jgi:hypothetical protein
MVAERARGVRTMTPSPATLAQTIILLALSRGETPYMPPITRNSLIAKRWIDVVGQKTRRDGSNAPVYGCTDAGLRALATSKYRDEAERKLDAGKRASHGRR